jgi:hypothetical protein
VTIAVINFTNALAVSPIHFACCSRTRHFPPLREVVIRGQAFAGEPIGA